MTWENVTAFSLGLLPFLYQLYKEKNAQKRVDRKDTVGEWMDLYNDTRAELVRVQAVRDKCDRNLMRESSRRRYLEAVMRDKGWHLDPEPPDLRESTPPDLRESTPPDGSPRIPPDPSPEGSV